MGVAGRANRWDWLGQVEPIDARILAAKARPIEVSGWAGWTMPIEVNQVIRWDFVPRSPWPAHVQLEAMGRGISIHDSPFAIRTSCLRAQAGEDRFGWIGMPATTAASPEYLCDSSLPIGLVAGRWRGHGGCGVTESRLFPSYACSFTAWVGAWSTQIQTGARALTKFGQAHVAHCQTAVCQRQVDTVP